MEEVVGGKSYNPFRMWGAWVGFGVMLIWSVYTFFIMFALGSAGIGFQLSDMTLREVIMFFPFVVGSLFYMVLPFGWIGIGVLFLSPIILGFLVGWGIHSLIKRIKVK